MRKFPVGVSAYQHIRVKLKGRVAREGRRVERKVRQVAVASGGKVEKSEAGMEMSIFSSLAVKVEWGDGSGLEMVVGLR